VTKIRVLVADDHTIVRQGLVGILAASADMEVVAEASDGNEAVEKSLKTKPDVVVLDVSMPRLSGIEAARRIHEALPAARILVLTMHDDEEYILKMVRAGPGLPSKDGAARAPRGIRTSRRQDAFGPHAAKALEEAFARDAPPSPRIPTSG
jgi:DNA-binding NarL/FixJ family response regulator